MMASAVRIQVTIKSTIIYTDRNGDIHEAPAQNEGWMGSGVVYDKTDRSKGPVRSRILSANHVLETPAVGSVIGDPARLFGAKRIESVDIKLQTADGRMCNVKVLALATSDTHDVATAEADCDAGRIAELGTAEPVMGQRVFICGFPLGVFLPMLTEGYVAGWMDGYLLTSAPAYGGNSGGPVFHDGKVVGLLVRGSREYPHLTLTVALEECLRRIAETPPLQ
jgi:S1-C subfamily serine protease